MGLSLANIFNNAPYAYLLLDDEFNVKEANEAAHSLLGRDIINTSLPSHINDPCCSIADFKATIQDNIPIIRPCLEITSHNNHFKAAIRAFNSTDGIIVFLEDVSEFEDTLDEIRGMNHFLQTVVSNAASLLLVIVDSNQDIAVWSKAAANMTGFPA